MSSTNEPVDFEVIVVGAGIAGCVAAHELARLGHEVLLVERAAEPGAKSLSGGVLYTRVMDHVWPDFASHAPVERHITRNCLMFLNEGSRVTIDYADDRLAEPVNAVSVLRAPLDAWLAERCTEAGVTVMSGVLVEELLFDGERVAGIRAGEDVLHTRVVIAADGINSFLCRSAGIRAAEPAANLALGIKSVVGLSRAVLEERFHLIGDEGVAYAVVGQPTHGLPGGGFLYTNRCSVSVGVVVRLDELAASTRSSVELHDRFLAHPAIHQLLDGGEPLEYGCHLIAEGGRTMQHDLTRPGLVVVGDAAGLTLNTGLTLRGMDLAAGSAIVAANVVHAHLVTCADDVLAGYPDALERSFVGRDMRTFAKAPHFLDNDRIYGPYGRLLADVLHDAYDLDTSPRRHLVRSGLAAVRRSPMSLRQLARDAALAAKDL